MLLKVPACHPLRALGVFHRFCQLSPNGSFSVGAGAKRPCCLCLLAGPVPSEALELQQSEDSVTELYLQDV